MTEASQKSGRRTLLILAAIFFTPLVFAWLMHFNFISWRPSSISANGQIIEPIHSLPEYQPYYLGGTAADYEFLHRKWHLLYIGGLECTQDCQSALVLMRQVRLSLGKYLDRIGRVYAAADERSLNDQFIQAFDGMQIIRIDTEMEKILQHVEADAGESIYLVDPLGNVMMRYPIDQAPRPMYEDLKHLLKLSRIG